MDTRKLRQDGRRIRQAIGGHEVAVCTGQQYADADRTEQQDAAEIVRRYNAYPELVEALREAKGTLAAIAEMSQRHDPETGFKRDLSPYDTYRSLLPCFQRLNTLLDTLKTN